MKTILTLFILALLGTGVGYYIYKEANKDNIKKLVQQVLDDNKIPVHIDELNLKADPRKLIHGVIDRIEIKGEITTIKKKFRFDSALQYKIENSTISLQASPLHLQVDELPKIDSVIGFYVKYKRIGTKIDLQDIHSAFVFDIPKPYKRSTTENTISFSKAHFENSLVYRFDLDNDRFILNSRGIFSDLTLENQHTEFSEKSVEYAFSAKSDGTELHAIKLDLINPIKLSASGSVALDKLDLQFATRLSFSDGLGYLDRIAKIPFLERIDGNGTIQVNGKLVGTPEKPQILSKVRINAEEIEIADIL